MGKQSILKFDRHRQHRQQTIDEEEGFAAKTAVVASQPREREKEGTIERWRIEGDRRQTTDRDKNREKETMKY